MLLVLLVLYFLVYDFLFFFNCVYSCNGSSCGCCWLFFVWCFVDIIYNFHFCACRFLLILVIIGWQFDDGVVICGRAHNIFLITIFD